MKHIIDTGEHSKMVLENEKELMWYIKWNFIKALLIYPFLGIIGFACSCYAVYFLMVHIDWFLFELPMMILKML